MYTKFCSLQFQIFGSLILGIGVLSFVLLGDNLDQLNTYTTVNWSIFAIMFVAAGILCILSMCICGCCGALKEHKLLLALVRVFFLLNFAIFVIFIYPRKFSI